MSEISTNNAMTDHAALFQRSTCTSFMRRQQDDILSEFLAVTSMDEGDKLTFDDFSNIRNHITSLMAKFLHHLELEDRFILRKMSKEPKLALLAGQFERETNELKNEFSIFAKKYLTASLIKNGISNFFTDIVKQQSLIEKSFKEKNRDLYCVFN